MVGIKVARKLRKNTNMTTNTKAIASSKVCTTLSIDSLINGEASYGTTDCKPLGKYCSNSANLAFTASAVRNALAPLAKVTAKPEDGLPL